MTRAGAIRATVSSLALKDLTKRRRNSAFTLTVTAIFEKGTTVVVGHNGSGKSTLLRVLATADKPDSGVYLADGASAITRRGVALLRRRLGWLPQVFGYEPSATVLSFLEYTVWMRGLHRSTFHEEPRRVLDLVGLSARSDSRIRDLSGGMIRRLGIASALIGDPDVLLLDEPTAGLDLDQRRKLYSTIKEVSKDKIVVIATHLPEDITELGERQIMLRDGRVISEKASTAD